MAYRTELTQILISANELFEVAKKVSEKVEKIAHVELLAFHGLANNFWKKDPDFVMNEFVKYCGRLNNLTYEEMGFAKKEHKENTKSSNEHSKTLVVHGQPKQVGDSKMEELMKVNRAIDIEIKTLMERFNKI